MILTALCAAASFFASAVSPSSQAPARPVAIHADKILLGDGRELENATIVLSNGRISEVGAKVDVPSGVETIQHKGVLSAGMIALHGYSGAVNEMRDDTRPALPEAHVGLVFDPSHYDFEDARAAGVTAIVLTPPTHGVSGGISAVVKSAGRKALLDESHLSLGFNASALLFNREPTSYSGALAMIEQMFTKPTGAVARAADGKLACLFEVTSREDVLRAVDFAKRHELKGAIHGASLAGELAADIKGSKLAVIVPALDVGRETRALKSVAMLAKSEIPFGFGLDSPDNHPAQLRLGAAMCVHAGLDAKAAWTALTSDAARIAGVADRTGRIERGLDADLVLWSGDPLDLGSKVVAVYIDGARVFGGDR